MTSLGMTRVLTAFAVVLLAATGALAQSALRGVLLDQNGRWADVKILVERDTDKRQWHTQSDSGSFTLELPPGHYRVVFYFPDVAPIEKRVKVRDTYLESLDVRLPPVKAKHATVRQDERRPPTALAESSRERSPLRYGPARAFTIDPDALKHLPLGGERRLETPPCVSLIETLIDCLEQADALAQVSADNSRRVANAFSADGTSPNVGADLPSLSLGVSGGGMLSATAVTPASETAGQLPVPTRRSRGSALKLRTAWTRISRQQELAVGNDRASVSPTGERRPPDVIVKVRLALGARRINR